MATTKVKPTDARDPLEVLKAENAELKKEMGQVKTLMAQMAQHLSAQGLLTPEPVRAEIPLEEQPWFVRPGSIRHAQILGLVQDDDSESGWSLDDPTVWGPAASDKFLQLVLEQKLNELRSETPQMQSVSPLSPNYAIPMWVPTD